MIVCDVKSCDYCQLSIATGQRWLREKIYDPRSVGQNSAYRHFHAEPIGGQEGKLLGKTPNGTRNCSRRSHRNELGGCLRLKGLERVRGHSRLEIVLSGEPFFPDASTVQVG